MAAHQVAVEAVAIAARQPAHVADELVGDAVAAHVDRVQDVVVERDAAVPAVERRHVARAATPGGHLLAVYRPSWVRESRVLRSATRIVLITLHRHLNTSSRSFYFIYLCIMRSAEHAVMS